MKKELRTWEAAMVDHLTNPKHALVYLQVAIEEYETDGDKEAFLIALRNVTDAQGGIRQLSERTGLNREHLYRVLSRNGNPHLDTIGKILNGLGFRLTLTSQQ